MSTELFALWTYLSAQPLTGLAATLLAFALAEWLHRRAAKGRLAPVAPLLNPVLVAAALLGAMLAATKTPYSRYFEGAQFVHFLLGPATVALAVPLHKNLGAVRRSAVAVSVGLVAGSLTAIGTAVGLAAAFGADRSLLATVAPKSVTTPVAMALAEQLGGLPPVTAIVVILTGVVGGVLGGPALDRARVSDPRARGLAYGVASHGVGTARAFSEGQTTGAFSSLALGANALFTALALPALAALLSG